MAGVHRHSTDVTELLAMDTIPQHAVTVQSYARISGVLGLVSVVAGGFGEAYVPAALVVPHDASATAANIVAREWLLRWGFAAYIVEATCDVSLTLLFYILFRVVHRELALGAVFFRLIGTAGFAMAQVFFFATLPTLENVGPLQAFAPDERQLLAMLLVRISHDAQTVFTAFYGVGTLAFGWLMYRSEFLPRVVGAIVMLAAAGFVAKAFTWVLTPVYSSPLLLAPAAIAFLLLSCWLVVRGIDAARWQEAWRREGCP
jgi:hypothetical protein